MDIRITGMDKLKAQLRQMQRAARELDGEHDVSFAELFPQTFMAKFTRFGSMEEFLEAAGIHAAQDFETMPDATMDTHVAAMTSFRTWEEMQDKAFEQYLCRKLGLG